MSWQGPWLVFVSTIVVASMMARAVITPTIINNNSVLKEETQLSRENVLSWTFQLPFIPPKLAKASKSGGKHLNPPV